MLILSTKKLAWISDIISCRLLPHWIALTAGRFRGYWGGKRLKVMSEIQATQKLQISRQVHHTNRNYFRHFLSAHLQIWEITNLNLTLTSYCKSDAKPLH